MDDNFICQRLHFHCKVKFHCFQSGKFQNNNNFVKMSFSSFRASEALMKGFANVNKNRESYVTKAAIGDSPFKLRFQEIY